jgi:lipopolysaccharide transport system ATP-binding protein
MSDVVIRAENLGKRYRIGERERYLALRDVLTRAASAPARLFRPRKASSSNGADSNGNLSNGSHSNGAHSNGGHNNGDQSHIWALKDASFEIRQGEVVGIIGRNGAGKSTLLKILARVTKPTKGFAELHGRMGTLLEVGTGFHPELTGRENVFLSGAILGMSKAEIRRKFDEIVDFSEVEKFIDTPLKHYSSGMQMRLAFAVAAHLEPEILLVDEVLAVGDMEFQRKCLGKMGNVAKAGRTVLFVSHNMGAIGQLCKRCILLEHGTLALDAPSDEAVPRYLAAHSKSRGTVPESKWDRFGTGRMRMTSIEICDGDGARPSSFAMGEAILLRVAGAAEPGSRLECTLSVQFVSLAGVPALWAYDQFATIRPYDGRFHADLFIECLNLMPGAYDVKVWIGRTGLEEYDCVQNAARIDVTQGQNIAVYSPISNALGCVYVQPRLTDTTERVAGKASRV